MTIHAVNSGKRHYSKIDLMRLIACFAVIAIHITATPVVHYPPNSPHQIFFLLINRLSLPSVPIFIFLSGFLNYKPDSPFSFKGYLGKFMRLFLPYFLWTSLYYLIFILRGTYPFSVSFWLKRLILGDMIYHLYFMVIIMQLTLLSPLFTWLSKRLGLRIFFILMVLVQVLVSLKSFPYADRLFLTYIAYYAAGYLMKKTKEGWVYKPLSLLVFIIFATIFLGMSIAGMNYGYYPPSFISKNIYMLYTLSACLALYWAVPETRLTKRGLTFSKSTETIYYAHPLALMLSSSILYKIGILSTIVDAAFSSLIILVVIIPLAYAYTYLKQNKLQTTEKVT